MLKQAEKHPITIKGSVLLYVYLIIPLCFLVVIIDYMQLDWHLRDSVLPRNPQSLLIWHLFFVFPHIFSSIITLADRDYIAFYRKRFGRALLFISLFVLSFNFIFPVLFTGKASMALNIVFVVIIAFATMYHVLSQQLGVSMSLMRLKSTGAGYEFWRWSNAVAGTFLYFMAFAGALLRDTHLFGNDLFDICRSMALLLIVVANIQGLLLASQARTRIGVYYAAANIIMLTSIYIMIDLEYSFFAIVIPRVIHDVTAFVVYSVHDRNRNLATQHNYFYRFLDILKLSPLFLCVILAVFIAQLVQCGSFYFDAWLGFVPQSVCVAQAFYVPEIKAPISYQSMQLWLQISLIASFFHYYMEAIIWKKGSPHRLYVSFR